MLGAIADREVSSMDIPKHKLWLVWWMTWGDKIHSRFHERRDRAEEHVMELQRRKDVIALQYGEVENCLAVTDDWKKKFIENHPELFERE
jgi:hypothetical protein